MVIQIDNQHYIEKADRFSGILVFLSKTKIFIKTFFGLIGLCVIAVVLSPFVLLLLWRLTAITTKMVAESKKQKEQLKLSLKEEDIKYSDLAEVESSIKRVIEKTEQVAYLKTKSTPKIISKFLDNLKSLHTELLEMQGIIKNSYSYTQKDLGLSDKEFAEYKNQFKDLHDIWDYESSPEEKEIVLIHKKRLQA